MIEAGFGFKIGVPNQWRLKKSLAGGGALMDVGIYALQACRYLTGEEPLSIVAQETKTDAQKFAEVDESLTWTMRFPSGVLAYCSTSYNFNGLNRFRAFAENGWFGMDPAYSYNDNRLELGFYGFAAARSVRDRDGSVCQVDSRQPTVACLGRRRAERLDRDRSHLSIGPVAVARGTRPAKIGVKHRRVNLRFWSEAEE
jgi:predicted dehydrogenase